LQQMGDCGRQLQVGVQRSVVEIQPKGLVHGAGGPKQLVSMLR
jgi:hypothetical protein